MSGNKRPVDSIATSAESQRLPETAQWRVKGDGVAYTTAQKIVDSQAGRRSIAEAAKVHLIRQRG